VARVGSHTFRLERARPPVVISVVARAAWRGAGGRGPWGHGRPARVARQECL